ncbi:MAG: galactose-1-phosphate uridylyltransferase [Candidatus Woesearchaeota archaeon]
MELRKDYLLNRWVIISEKRGTRPKQFEKVMQKKDGFCFFCPGNEKTTPPEIGRISEDGKWIIRWFPNKFPAVSAEGKFSVHNGFLTHANAFGYHEVITETPDHTKQLSDLSPSHIAKVFKVYAQRINELSKKKNVSYVVIFKNHGGSAGTSLVHSHTQLATLPFVPAAVAEEVKASSPGCKYCKIIAMEKRSKRLVLENSTMLAIAPYASRFNYEAWIFPKKHAKSITEFSEKEYSDCADILKKLLVKLASLNADYNFIMHYAPKGKNLHFHIELLPRLSNWAGFEYCSGIIINSVSPESAAEFYRQ